eukprot:5547376-Pyramimonas_sp.AAC.1
MSQGNEGRAIPIGVKGIFTRGPTSPAAWRACHACFKPSGSMPDATLGNRISSSKQVFRTPPPSSYVLSKLVYIHSCISSSPTVVFGRLPPVLLGDARGEDIYDSGLVARDGTGFAVTWLDVVLLAVRAGPPPWMRNLPAEV